MPDHLPEETPVDGVSKKLKIFVIILTVVTFLTLVALFTKLVNKPIVQKQTQPNVQRSNSKKDLSDE